MAEDLTAETFARALERWHRFDPRRGGARTWLCQLARSTALDHFRSEERRRRREGRYAVGELRESAEAVFGEGLSPVLERAARAAVGGRARGDRAPGGAGARRRERRRRARDQRLGLLDPPEPSAGQAREGGERRCRRLSSWTTALGSSRASCAPRDRGHRPSCGSGSRPWLRLRRDERSRACGGSLRRSRSACSPPRWGWRPRSASCIRAPASARLARRLGRAGEPESLTNVFGAHTGADASRLPAPAAKALDVWPRSRPDSRPPAAIRRRPDPAGGRHGRAFRPYAAGDAADPLPRRLRRQRRL